MSFLVTPMFATSLGSANVAISNTAVETFFAKQPLLPSLNPGDWFDFDMRGVYSTATLAPTLRGRFYIGSTLVLDTGALAAVAGTTNGGWFAKGTVTVLDANTVEAQGDVAFATSATAALTAFVVNTGPVTVAASGQLLRASVQWSAASASNSITQRIYNFKSFRPN